MRDVRHPEMAVLMLSSRIPRPVFPRPPVTAHIVRYINPSSRIANTFHQQPTITAPLPVSLFSSGAIHSALNGALLKLAQSPCGSSHRKARPRPAATAVKGQHSERTVHCITLRRPPISQHLHRCIGIAFACSPLRHHNNTLVLVCSSCDCALSFPIQASLTIISRSPPSSPDRECLIDKRAQFVAPSYALVALQKAAERWHEQGYACAAHYRP